MFFSISSSSPIISQTLGQSALPSPAFPPFPPSPPFPPAPPFPPSLPFPPPPFPPAGGAGFGFPFPGFAFFRSPISIELARTAPQRMTRHIWKDFMVTLCCLGEPLLTPVTNFHRAGEN